MSKKLLILSASHNEVDLVERAKELGYYTIVTDWYDTVHSPAKLIADEYWDISWNDIDSLEAQCRTSHIDGVIGGYSEFVVESVIDLCERLHLPCYCTKEQLDTTRDKIKFKKVCRENGVPVVNEYTSIEDVNTFPVIVKPTDRAGSIGISIAYDKDQLEKSIAIALGESVSKSVIIEDYIANGIKFDAYYSIINGDVSLLATSDTIMAHSEKSTNVIQSIWKYPSKYQENYIKKIDTRIRKMILSLGIHDGYFFFSGFSLPQNTDVDFVFFECGFRLSGEHAHSYITASGNSDIRDILIQYALYGKTQDLSFFDCSQYGNIKSVAVNYYLKSGIPFVVHGVSEIGKMTDCNFYLSVPVKGVQCSDDSAIFKKVAMFHFINESWDCLNNDIKKANEYISVTDKDNYDLIYERPELLL